MARVDKEHDLTLDELIEQLQEYSKAGYGNYYVQAGSFRFGKGDPWVNEDSNLDRPDEKCKIIMPCGGY